MANRDKFLDDFSGKFKQSKKFRLHEDEVKGKKRKDNRDRQRQWKERVLFGEEEGN